MSWADDRRADRIAAAEQRRADQDAAAARVRADRAAAAARQLAERDAARARRDQRRAKVARWVSAHTIELLFAPVVIVPAVLAWSAIAHYGVQLYGAPGALLPLFSEAAMWVFAFARAAAAKVPGRSTARLALGQWLTTGVSAVLAFLHGVTRDGGTVADGLVMALVSTGGVIVHHLVTTAQAGRRTRAERAAERLSRAAERRLMAVRRAAIRQAVAQLAEDGTATLVHRTGLVRLDRRRGRARVVPATLPGLPVEPIGQGLGDEIAADVSAYLSAFPRGSSRQPGTAETVPPRLLGFVERVRAGIASGELPEQPSKAAVRKYLRCRGEVAAEVHRVLFPDDDGPRQPAHH